MLTKILNILFPKVSIHDQKYGEYLSAEGRKKLIPHPELCPASHLYSHDFQTLTPYRKDFPLEGLHICFAYTGYLKKLILMIKYRHQYDVVSFVAQRMFLSIQTNQTLQKHIQKYPSIITYVPSHRRRKYVQKGYNQSEKIAQNIGNLTHIPVHHMVDKTKYTRSQISLTRSQRIHNLKGAFRLSKNTGLQGNECIIIVDDITTTGSTIIQIAQTIKKTYPKTKIWGLVAGRHTG